MTPSTLSFHVIRIVSHEMIRNELDFELNDSQCGPGESGPQGLAKRYRGPGKVGPHGLEREWV